MIVTNFWPSVTNIWQLLCGLKLSLARFGREFGTKHLNSPLFGVVPNSFRFQLNFSSSVKRVPLDFCALLWLNELTLFKEEIGTVGREKVDHARTEFTSTS